jgi:hypothetical protein
VAHVRLFGRHVEVELCCRVVSHVDRVDEVEVEVEVPDNPTVLNWRLCVVQIPGFACPRPQLAPSRNSSCARTCRERPEASRFPFDAGCGCRAKQGSSARGWWEMQNTSHSYCDSDICRQVCFGLMRLFGTIERALPRVSSCQRSCMKLNNEPYRLFAAYNSTNAIHAAGLLPCHYL